MSIDLWDHCTRAFGDHDLRVGVPTNHQPTSWSLLGEVVLVGEGLVFVFSDEFATIVFPLLVRTIRNEMAHIATVEASSNSLLALDAT